MVADASNVFLNTLVPTPLSRAMQAAATGSGYKLDVTIAGIPFNMKPTQENPWLWTVKEDRRDQFDNSREAGEQSFGYWWLRSQSTYHGGAGQTFSDTGTVDPAIARTRFYSSTGMNVFSTQGQVTPYPAASSTAISTIVRAVPFVRSGVNKIAVARGDNDTVDFYNVSPYAFDQNVSLTEAATVCRDIATDGERLFVAINNKIIRIDAAGAQVDIATLTFTKAVRLGYAKQRLILTHGGSVYEVDTDPGAPPVALGAGQLKFTVKTPNWQFSDIADGPNAIYLAGFAGLTGQIYRIGETESGGTLTLGAGALSMSLPTGEIPYALQFYVNSLFVIGTSSGARVGNFTPYGAPQYGALSFDREPVRAVGALASTAILGGDSATWFLDLGNQIDQAGRYPYAHYHTKVSTANQNYVSIVTSGAVGAPAVFPVTDHHIERDSADGVGILTSSWFTFNTTEPKQSYYIAITAKLPTGGSFPNDTAVITVETYEGSQLSFPLAADSSRSTWEFGLNALPASQAYRVKIQINTGVGVNFVTSVQIKAMPQEKRYEQQVYPLMVADYEQTSSGQICGYDNFGRDRLRLLMDLAETNPTVTLVNNVTGDSFTTQLRNVEFNQGHGIAPAPGRKVTGTVNVYFGSVI